VAKLTKADVVASVAQSAGVSKADAERVIDAFFDETTRAVKGGDEVSWPKFGKFSKSERAARMGRNPQTGEAVQVPASTSMKFSAAAALKESMKG
jgi:DNA-binding protein HU-beta